MVYFLNEKGTNILIIFCATCAGTVKLALMLQRLGFSAVALHGQMSQPKRLGALNKFKSKARSILVCTDVAARGLDIPHVDIVVNYDVPGSSKDYIHRVGRTARAGRSGMAITVVTQYDVEQYQKIEKSIGKRLEDLKLNHENVMQLVDRVSEAARYAANRYKELDSKRGHKNEISDDDEQQNNRNKRRRITGVRKGK